MKNYSSVLIIYNPNAMRGKIEEFLPRVKQRLSVRYSKVDIVTSPNENGSEELARKNSGKYDIILSCGGDGTLHDVVNGVLKSGFNPIIGILPFGTCNDVAHSLNVPSDLDLATDCVLRLNTTPYDVMSVGDTYITYSMATGYLTNASYETKQTLKRRFKRMAYVFQGTKGFFKFNSLPLTVTADGERIHDNFSFLMLMNSRRVGGFKLNMDENLNNNKAKLVLIKGNGFGSFRAFAKLFTHGVNAVKKNKRVIVRDVNSVQIENHSNSPFVLDGEKYKFLKKTINVDKKITMICGR